MRGTLSDILVVCLASRGHPVFEYGGLSAVLAGGSLHGGRVYGETGPDGTACKPPVSVADLWATVFNAVGVEWGREYVLENRRRKYVAGGTPLYELF